MAKEKAKKIMQKKTKSLEQTQGGEINRVSGGGKQAWTVGCDRVSMFGSEEEEEEEERSYLRASSHRVASLVSSVGNDESQLDRFILRTSILDEHS